MKRDEVINRVAALVSPKHKVNLGNPDKVILIEIFKVGFSSPPQLPRGAIQDC